MSRRGRNSLRVVGGVFASRELELAREVGAHEGALQAALVQLNELRAHQRKLGATAATGGATDPGRMQNQQAFFARLGEAIRQQEATVRAARAERDEARRRWLLGRQKKTAIEKVCARRDVQLKKRQERREQQASDERSSRPRQLD